MSLYLQNGRIAILPYINADGVGADSYVCPDKKYPAAIKEGDHGDCPCGGENKRWVANPHYIHQPSTAT